MLHVTPTYRIMRNPLLLILLLFVPFVTEAQQQEARLLRFPAVHGNQIVFSYAGDLYSVDSRGGMARRLTSHDGYEMFPRFSPDGSVIAFTGQYDGNTEVFTIPSKGGVPRRLTYTATLGRDDVADRMGPNNIVMAWTPDGHNITFRSRKESFNSFIGQLFTVSDTGGLSKELPLPTGGFCSWSPDGKKLAYNRIFREFRTWKYYRGGMADEIWIHDFETKETRAITDNDVQDIEPMWAGDEIYFLSDRDRTMNLFVYNTVSGETRKVTDFTDYDIKFPSLGKDYIVFENGGFIYKFSLATKKAEQVHITIANEQPFSRNAYVDASKYIRDGDLSPNGERVAFGARGEIFSLPAEHGITENLTKTPGAHERAIDWSPDGRYIAYFSDESGEYEVYILRQDGTEEAKQLTHGSHSYMYNLDWSPDSKKILFCDRDLTLKYVDVASGKVTLVKKSKRSELRDFSWSPDSKWIAFTETDVNEFDVIYLYNLESGKTVPVTANWYDSGDPEFSADGKYLFFVSRRDFRPTYSNTEWNHAYTNMSKIYLVTLASGTPSPFAPENDVVEVKDDGGSGSNGGGKKDPNGSEGHSGVTVRIDTDNMNQRILSLPVPASNYYNLQAAGDAVYYTERSSGSRGPSNFKMFDLKKKKETDLGSGFRYVISSNGKKMLVSQRNRHAVIDLPHGKITIEDPIDVSGMEVLVDYHKEWKQIFDESWRQMRDFFYVSNMHGLDWKAMHDKYAVLLPYVNHRNDLTYIIGEMISELSVGHSYVLSGNQRPMPKRIETGLLGARLSKHSSGYFRIDKILEGANWNDQLRSPLTEIGVDVGEGDYITAVNGQSTGNMKDIYASLVGKAGKQVELSVNTEPKESGSRKTIVVPISDESGLYYYNWVQENIRKVNEATGGQIGYVHIPDMGVNGLNIFAEYFYPQLRDKKGLIIDDRGNGGGNVSPMIIERLSRVMTHAGSMRGIAEGEPVPGAMVLGPKVLLIDYASASDGDLFAYQFKKKDLGTVIGTRTWGGVVGIRGSLPFIDGGSLNKPEFAHYSADESKWIIEGHGVDPDIVIDNDPSREYEGTDDQLNKAIEVIMGQLDQYKPVPPVPPAPDKSK